MADNFAVALPLILRHEGGYADHSEDPGGATNMGITHRTLADWRGVATVTKAQVKALTVDEAGRIYRANYWDRLRCDDLPAGVDVITFDFGVNAGTARSARLLQSLVGAKADGVVGPATLAAVQRHPDHGALCVALTEGRMKHYRSLKQLWPTFGKGWTRRTDETHAFAMRLHVGSAPRQPDDPGITDADVTHVPPTGLWGLLVRIVDAILAPFGRSMNR